MSIIKVAGKKFQLASRWARLGAFLLDIGLLGFCQVLLIFLGFVLFEVFDSFSGFRDASNMTSVSVGTLSFILWDSVCFLWMDLKREVGLERDFYRYRQSV